MYALAFCVPPYGEAIRSSHYSSIAPCFEEVSTIYVISIANSLMRRTDHTSFIGTFSRKIRSFISGSEFSSWRYSAQLSGDAAKCGAYVATLNCCCSSETGNIDTTSTCSGSTRFAAGCNFASDMPGALRDTDANSPDAVHATSPARARRFLDSRAAAHILTLPTAPTLPPACWSGAIALLRNV